MDKKLVNRDAQSIDAIATYAVLIEEIISDVATANQISDEEARTLVCLSLRHNRATIANSIKIATYDTGEDEKKADESSEYTPASW